MNKILILISCILVGAGAAHAQTQKGNQLLGGFLSLGTNKGSTNYVSLNAYNNSYVTNDKVNSLSVGPTYSYFIADQLDLGASAGYFTQKQTNTYTTGGADVNKAKGYNLAVFLRKYFLYENKIGFRVGPLVQYQYNNNKLDYNNSSYSDGQTASKVFNAGVGVDFVYFPTRRLGLAATLGSLGYTHVINTQEYTDQFSVEDKYHSVGLNLATSNLAISVVYALGK